MSELGDTEGGRSVWKAWSGTLVVITILTCSHLSPAAWTIKFKFKGYFLSVSTILNLRNKNCGCCFVPSTIASLTLSRKVEDRYSLLAVCVYTSRFCIIQHAEPWAMTLSNPVDSNCTFRSPYWYWSNICVFTLPLVVLCEFWEFESYVLTITPGKTQHSPLALCWWQPSVASVFLHIHLRPFENSHWVERPPFLLPHTVHNGWITYLFNEIKFKKKKA